MTRYFLKKSIVYIKCWKKIITSAFSYIPFALQVITGGSYDVDMELMGPRGDFLYKENKKQYDSYTWTTAEKGEYKFCFSNEFSTFSHKVVYFDFIVGDDDDDFNEEGEEHHTAMTQVNRIRTMHLYSANQTQ